MYEVFASLEKHGLEGALQSPGRWEGGIMLGSETWEMARAKRRPQIFTLKEAGEI